MTDAPTPPERKRPKPRVEYSEDVAARFCERLASGESPANICKSDDMPTLRAIQMWTRDIPEFRQAVIIAREQRADLRAEQISDMAEEVRNGSLDYNKGRVAIAALQWLASKESPRRYGDRVVAEHTGKGGGPILVQGGSDADLMRAARWVADLFDKAQAIPADSPTMSPALQLDASEGDNGSAASINGAEVDDAVIIPPNEEAQP